MAQLKELLVINAEISALSRAGIPIELGLRRLEVAAPGRLGRLASRLAVRLEMGHSLPDAIRLEEDQVSRTYASVMRAALAANRLPHALDALVAFGQSIVEVQRRLIVSLFYPAVVMLAAYCLLAIFLLVVAPEIVRSWEISQERESLLAILEGVRRLAIWWVWAVPLAVVAAVSAVARMRRSRADIAFVAAQHDRTGLTTAEWLPGVPGLFADLDRAHATHLLGLLLDQQVPMPAALELTADACGSRKLHATLQALSSAVQQGRSLGREVDFMPDLPQLLRDTLRVGATDPGLPLALFQVAEIYRRRAVRRSEWMRSTLAPVLLVLIGGTATLVYALTLALPLSWFYQTLLDPFAPRGWY